MQRAPLYRPPARAYYSCYTSFSSSYLTLQLPGEQDVTGVAMTMPSGALRPMQGLEGTAATACYIRWRHALFSAHGVYTCMCVALQEGGGARVLHMLQAAGQCLELEQVGFCRDVAICHRAPAAEA